MAIYILFIFKVSFYYKSEYQKMKNKLFFLVSVLLISLNNAKAMEEDRFQKTPGVLIVEIGSYLYGEDFINFSLANKRTRNYLLNNKNFFLPENQEEITKIIQETSIEKISNLILKGGRAPKKKIIPLLRNVLNEFKDNKSIENNNNLKKLQIKYKNYVIILNLLYKFGDNKVRETFNNLYDENEVGYENTMNHSSPNQTIIRDIVLCKFYHKRLSLLYPYYREEISKAYREGTPPYEKNCQKSLEYERKLDLPLSYPLSEN
jgi:hypothetical protein